MNRVEMSKLRLREPDNEGGRDSSYSELEMKVHEFTKLYLEHGVLSPKVEAFIQANIEDRDFCEIADGVKALAKLGEDLRKHGISMRCLPFRIPGIDFRTGRG